MHLDDQCTQYIHRPGLKLLIKQNAINPLENQLLCTNFLIDYINGLMCL